MLTVLVRARVSMYASMKFTLGQSAMFWAEKNASERVNTPNLRRYETLRSKDAYRCRSSEGARLLAARPGTSMVKPCSTTSTVHDTRIKHPPSMCAKTQVTPRIVLAARCYCNDMHMIAGLSPPAKVSDYVEVATRHMYRQKPRILVYYVADC